MGWARGLEPPTSSPNSLARAGIRVQDVAHGGRSVPASRRDFLKRALAAAVVGSVAPWTRALAASAIVGPSPYGAPGAPDEHGIRLPDGFRARRIGRTGDLVTGSSYVWHGQPDGGATFETPDRGWVYVSNSELNGTRGGVGAIRFDASGAIVDAYRILGGTKWDCAEIGRASCRERAESAACAGAAHGTRTRSEQRH